MTLNVSEMKRQFCASQTPPRDFPGAIPHPPVSDTEGGSLPGRLTDIQAGKPPPPHTQRCPKAMLVGSQGGGGRGTHSCSSALKACPQMYFARSVRSWSEQST